MLKQALLELEIEPHEVVMVFGVGCSGNGSNFTEVYGFHGLHGRAVPVAQGIKLVNKALKVIVIGGDGDGMGIGLGHFMHASRRNMDITYILHDNQIYGLTTGQASPRSDKGFVTKTSTEGTIEEPINPITVALSAKATHISRSFSGSPHHLKDTLKRAIQHKGFSFVDVMQPCITFNKHNTYAWYTHKVYDLNETDHDSSNRNQAWEKANEWGEKIPMGTFYSEEKPTYEDLMNLKQIPVTKDLSQAVNIKSLLKKYQV
jgi:2-oxoglutarate ferredoxin oxidoreductase subunit beta